MKKFRLLPSILMLVLCTAVLAVGIYAASPTSHSIVGTVKITAGGANVSITGYLDDGDGNYSDDVKVTDTYTSRTAQTINIYANALDFDCSSASDISQVAEKKLYFKVENLSAFSLGAYFLEGTVPESGTTSSNIAETKNFNGTMGQSTISNLITATFTPYSEVPVSGSAYMYSTLKLNQLNSEASTVTLNLNLNIEKYNSALGSATKENAVTINAVGSPVSVKCSINNSANDVETTFDVSNTYEWNSGGVAFADDMYLEQYRLPTICLNIEVTNTNDYPIKAIVKEGKNNNLNDNIEATTTDNSYIPKGKVGVVSIQFSAVYDREKESVTTIPEIGTYCYGIVIEEVDEISSTYVYDKIKYDTDTSETGMPVRGLYYYIEYGDNPYYNEQDAILQGASYLHRRKLRWYVWAKDDGNGNPTALTSSDKIVDNGENKLAKGNTYYFISEYVLSDGGICYQNERSGGGEDAINYNNNPSNDYSESDIRAYLNGITVKDNQYGNYAQSLANGENENFYNSYNLTVDPIFSLIKTKKLGSIYNELNNEYNPYDDEYVISLPTNNSNVSASDEEKFWLINRTMGNEFVYGVKEDSDYCAYWLGSGKENKLGYWWMCTPCGEWAIEVGEGFFSDAGYDPWAEDIGARPVFMLDI